MVRKKSIIEYVSILSLMGLICIMLLNHFCFDKSIRDWYTAKSAIDKMRKEIMIIHSLSEKEYMQCAVGIWILAIIEADDIIKLLKLNGNTDKENKAITKTITLIKHDQASMRVLFYVKMKQIRDVWSEKYAIFLIKLLKEEPPNTLLDDTERYIIDAFYKKYKECEDVLKRKMIGGKLTFVENAIKRIQEFFLCVWNKRVSKVCHYEKKSLIKQDC